MGQPKSFGSWHWTSDLTIYKKKLLNVILFVVLLYSVSFTNKITSICWRFITVGPSCLFVPWSSYVQFKSITSFGTVRFGVIATTANFWREKFHLRVVKGMSPDSGVVHIIAISPEPGIEILLDPMSNEAVVFLPVVDLHQPSSVELTFPPGVLPIMSDIREKVLMTRLKYFHLEFV